MENWNEWHKLYEENKNIKEHVDAMFELIFDYCKENELAAANDDRAEELVAAITKYIKES